MTVYVDSSVVLRWLLQQPGAIERWGAWQGGVSSELMRVEVRRGLYRLRAGGRLSDEDLSRVMFLFREVTAGFEMIRVLPVILERAGSPMPTRLGTLDAIHLATALLWIDQKGEPLTLLTHDAELAMAAQASGLDVLPAAEPR
jgi:predicted nucleic acid-binding protein